MRKRWITAVATLGLATGLGVGLATATGATHRSQGPATVAAPAIAQELGRAFGTGFTAKLTGTAEVPAGKADATGTALIRFNPAEGLVCFKLVVTNAGQPIIAAHIHRGAAGVAGPVVVPLATPTATSTNANVQQSKGCVSADVALIRQIMASPAQFYVNAHTKEFPGGVVRGQLVKLKEKPLATKTCPKPKKKHR
jgi:CHRD domain-containing protein